MKRAGLCALLCFGSSTCDRAPTNPPDEPPVDQPAEQRAAPRLVVLVVIDQLPSWSFDVQRHQLDGGIARMLASGVYWPRATYPYATTNTAPGHATIATGTTPHEHGILANRWLDAPSGERLEAADDAASPAWDPTTGKRRDEGYSGRRLLVDGLADALHAGRPSARAVTVAWKPRAAVLMLGRAPDLALWFDGKAGAMTTGVAYADPLPPWIGELATKSIADPARKQVWQPIDARTAKLSGRIDDAPDEGEPDGLGRVFPHDAHATSSPNRALGVTPLANAITVDTAIAAVDHEHLGQDDATDLLGISFSAHDHAGHAWCQESWERVDHLLRIDRELGRLFSHLDQTVGEDRWAAVLTSDHGTLPSRTLLKERGTPSTLFFTDDLAGWANDAAAKVLGPGKWVLGATTVEITMTPAFRQRSDGDRDRALDAVVTDLLGRGLGTVVRRDRRAATCEGDDVAALVCRSIHPDRSGEIYMASKEWDLINDDKSECSAHGSPWPYDREVPLVVMAPGVRPAEQKAATSILRVTPTIAALAGVAPPSHAHAAPLVLE